jgi:hypothetical protein
MENNSTTQLLETPHLTVVRKEKKANAPAKLVNLKKNGDKGPMLLQPPQSLLPPQPEMYIKAKKHDFF